MATWSGDLPQELVALFPRTPDAIVSLAGDNGPWRISFAHEITVLRRYDPQRYPPESAVARVTWLHEFLERLARQPFIAPRPIASLAGSSVAVVAGAIWDTLCFLPGEVVAWDRDFPLEEIGRIIGRFHVASVATGTSDQRPAALPLSECLPTSRAEIAARFQVELEAISHDSTPTCVIHGDPTADNVLTDTSRRHAVSLIDFTIAYRESPLADLAFGMWRTGRPSQDAVEYDLDRIEAIVRGYHQTIGLTHDDAGKIATYLKGRGLQMLCRAEAAGRIEPMQLARLSWVDSHQPEIRQAAMHALY